jgi:DNA modification methylase
MIPLQTSRKLNTIDCEVPTVSPYLSVLQGEFPWCLDDSEETGESSNLIGSFDLVIADPISTSKSNGSKKLQEHCNPKVSWISYLELFMKENASLLVFSPLESIGSYVKAFLEVGLNYHTAYLWQKNRIEKSDNDTNPFVAILWASKGVPASVFAPENRLLNSSLIANINNSSLLTISNGERSALLQFLVQSFTKPDMSVLEPFTNDLELIAICQKLSRHCLAVSRKRSLVKQAERLLLGSLQQTA